MSAGKSGEDVGELGPAHVNETLERALSCLEDAFAAYCEANPDPDHFPEGWVSVAQDLIGSEKALERYAAAVRNRPRSPAWGPLEIRDVVVEGHEVQFPDDDAPAEDADRLCVGFAGNLDYYVQVRPGNEEMRFGPPGFRASTSGARNPVVTSLVAALYKLGRGDNESALAILEHVCERLRA